MNNTRWLGIAFGFVLVGGLVLALWRFGVGIRTVPPTITEITAQWGEATRSIRTLRGSQTFHLLAADGSLQAPAHQDDLWKGTALSTEEILSLDSLSTSNPRIRYRFTEHTTRGDLVMGWDGTRAYKHASWTNEVYYPLPEGPDYGMNAYWLDDAGDMSIFEFLAPSMYEKTVEQIYDFVGTREIDGRQVYELVVKPGHNSSPNGISGSHIFLEASTFLPYRSFGNGDPSNSNPNLPIHVHTATQLAVNPPLFEDDLTFTPPAGATIIYEAAAYAPPLASSRIFKRRRAPLAIRAMRQRA